MYIKQINFSLQSLDSGTRIYFSSSISISLVNIFPPILHTHFHLCSFHQNENGAKPGNLPQSIAFHKLQSIGQKNAFNFYSSKLLKWMAASLSFCCYLCLSRGQSIWDLWQTKWHQYGRFPRVHEFSPPFSMIPSSNVAVAHNSSFYGVRLYYKPICDLNYRYFLIAKQMGSAQYITRCRHNVALSAS